jgi:hypothetical protein
MKQPTTVIAAGLLALASMSSARLERPVPFKVGETLTYDVSWSSYLTAGTATASVEGKQPRLHSIVYKIVAEGRPLPLIAQIYAVHYRAESLVDAYTLLPQHAAVHIEEGGRKKTRETDFDRKSQPLARDGLSAVYALRATIVGPGQKITLQVVENGVAYAVRGEVGPPESIRALLATLPAWKVALTATDEKNHAAGRNMALWISTDARRLPVRLQAELPVGNFNLVLRDVR